MKNLILVCVIAFAFCSTAMASEIAISTQAGWFGQDAADREAQEIADNVTGASVELFTSTQQAALATWVQDHTGDGTVDLLILFGQFPNTIYASGNAQPNGSLAELFLDDGNCIVNTGDWIFYVVDGAGSNGGAGLQNMMDIPGVTVAGEDDTPVTVTPDGQDYTPTLANFATDRPFHLDTLANNWEVELILAGNAAGTRADPVIVVNTVTGGRIGIFYQTAGQDSDPRGEVISEWINNWFLTLVASGNPLARRPIPADGATYTATWVSCQWTPGDFAESHDVYFSDSFADVDAGTPDAFRGNWLLGTDYFIAGLSGYDYPTGLVPGDTYYWRIDEVKVGDPNSPWRGRVWSFSIPPQKAHNPVPSDGAYFVDPDVTLSWTPGMNPFMHHVYFGDNPDDVAAGTGGTDKGEGPAASFVPGTLEPEKTYYWRVDTTDALSAMHTGDVWSFTVAKEGGGLLGEYYHWSGNFPPPNAFQVFVLSRIDPQVDFGWGDDGGDATLRGINSPDPLVNVNLFACRWTGEVEAAFTETYTFYMVTDDGQRLWVDGELIIDHWVEQGDTEYSGTIDLVAGQRYSIVAEHYENGGGATARLRWSSEHTPKQAIPQAALSPPVRAGGPRPSNGATNVSQLAVLSWNAGTEAASHEVYFGTDPDALTRVATKALGEESYDPGKLASGTTYYWRVNEINNQHPDSPWVGSLWSFTTANFFVVDNFEDYKGDEVPVTEQIWGVYHDGVGYGAVGAPPYYAGNGTGSEIGDVDTTSYTEETITHDGSDQSMPYWYNNNKPDKFKYSEAKRTLPAGLRDWTEGGIKALSLWFQGRPASTGSFVEAPTGTYTMTASGADIWDIGPAAGQYHDEFHFAYKQLTGAGTIIAKVESVDYTHDWAKAGVMIRETLDADSPHAFACISPVSGVAAQGRPDNGAASFGTTQAGIAAPRWVRLDRDAGGNFTVSHSADGSNWEPVTGAVPQSIQMNTNLYIGLALTSHDAALTCEAVFSNVTISGNVSGQWAHQDIGIISNDPEPMYVAIANNAGQPAVVYHDDAAATQIDTWTEWNIDLTDFAGINLADVNSIAIGFGDRNNPQAGSAGKMYFDDIALYRPRYVPGKGTPLAADLSSDGVVDHRDLRILAYQWLFETEVPDWDHRVAYWDADYPTGWAEVQVTEAVRDHLALNGYTVVNAAQLKTWMDARIADGVPSVVVFCKDIVPDTVAETMDATCTLRQYLNAGGKVVWYADWPIYYQGLSDGTSAPTWGGAGATSILGLNASSGPNNTMEDVFITAAGTAWGLTQTWPSQRPTSPVAENLTALATITGGSAAGWAKHYVPGDYYRGFFRIADFDTGPADVADLLPNILSVAEAKGTLAADLNDDMTVDFKDFAILLNQWLEEQLWPEP